MNKTFLWTVAGGVTVWVLTTIVLPKMINSNQQDQI